MSYYLQPSDAASGESEAPPPKDGPKKKTIYPGEEEDDHSSSNLSGKSNKNQGPQKPGIIKSMFGRIFSRPKEVHLPDDKDKEVRYETTLLGCIACV